MRRYRGGLSGRAKGRSGRAGRWLDRRGRGAGGRGPVAGAAVAGAAVAGVRWGSRKSTSTGTTYATQAMTSSTLGVAVKLIIPPSRAAYQVLPS